MPNPDSHLTNIINSKLDSLTLALTDLVVTAEELDGTGVGPYGPATSLPIQAGSYIAYDGVTPLVETTNYTIVTATGLLTFTPTYNGGLGPIGIVTLDYSVSPATLDDSNLFPVSQANSVQVVIAVKDGVWDQATFDQYVADVTTIQGSPYLTGDQVQILQYHLDDINAAAALVF
ncbi:hypothetical protein LCGC14_0145080 [marine sediment metagenome]|uniref:Uncharacterized protein n=1 Tax=marine sediment metagenome TaxID=412755 RepID=A0A0F9XH77_9ZZZZ